MLPPIDIDPCECGKAVGDVPDSGTSSLVDPRVRVKPATVRPSATIPSAIINAVRIATPAADRARPMPGHPDIPGRRSVVCVVR